jgi:MATE family, multidrug efflux pump
MSKKVDFTQGKIFGSLIKMAMPIMATSFIQMAYNLIDMIWIGRLGSSSVAAVGSAGFYVWLGFSFIIISRVGAEVTVSQSIGRKDLDSAVHYAANAVQLVIVLGIIYGSALIIFRNELIGFFRLQDQYVINSAISYLVIIAFGTIFTFINPVFSSIYNGTGDSKTPFKINSVGLVLNIFLDPMLIFGWGPFPEMGVEGAAIATVFSQMVVTIYFIVHFSGKKAPLETLKIWVKPRMIYLKEIVKLGAPIGLHSGLFTIFAIIIARIIAQWGPIPIAVQKVGSQLEALSYMTAHGFSTALATFTGQNYGNKNWNRIWHGYFAALASMTVFGIAVSLFFILGARWIFSLFIPEEEAIRQGAIYLRIMGYSQLFMCWEITTRGAFNGIGRTIPHSVVGVFFTGLRVPAAMIVSSAAMYGLNGVWWSISITSVFKGVILVVWFILLLYKHPQINSKEMIEQILCRWNPKYFRDKRCFTGKE